MVICDVELMFYVFCEQNMRFSDTEHVISAKTMSFSDIEHAFRAKTRSFSVGLAKGYIHPETTADHSIHRYTIKWAKCIYI